MAGTSIVIAGFPSSSKTPGLVRETKYGQGRVSIGQIPVKCVVTGNKTSAGTATADSDILPVYSQDQADTYAGAGSEGALQLRAALDIPGITLYYAPVAAPSSSPTAATLTATVAGTWSTTGTATLWLGGKAYSTGVAATDSVTTVAANLSSAVNGDANAFCTASPSVGVITFTVKSTGARGNGWICRKDLSVAPAGMTITLAGGTALTGGMTPFSGGAGADDVTNVLALLATDVYDIQGWAQADSTNAALIRAQVQSEASPLKMHLEHAIFATTRGTSTSASFAQTTLNEYRCSVVHLTNCEWAPASIAAQMAAVRSAMIGDNPNFNFDDLGTAANPSGLSLTIPPQSQKADIPLRSVTETLLSSGVTPLTTTPDGRVKIVRAIQSHSLNGSNPDYRTLDWGDVDVPDRVSKEIGAQFDVFKAANPYVGDDPGPGSQPPVKGVGTPSRWQASITKVLKDSESQNWLQDVDLNPPIVEYNNVAKRLMAAVPCVVRTQHHGSGASIRQTASP